MKMEQMISSEPKFRLNIKQNAKLEKYWDVTVKADTIEELTVQIEAVKRLAMIQTGQMMEENKDEPV